MESDLIQQQPTATGWMSCFVSTTVFYAQLVAHINIASRPLKLRKVPKKNQMLHPDLSYLQTAPQDSLAGRLAKPTLHSEKTNLGRAPIQESTWETVKIDIDAITQKRKEERLARESFEKSTPHVLPTKRSKSNFFFYQPPEIAAANQKRAEARIGTPYSSKKEIQDLTFL